jgi:hypothetical protein
LICSDRKREKQEQDVPAEIALRWVSGFDAIRRRDRSHGKGRATIEPMKRARCLLRWTFVCGFLCAVGFGVFHFVRYRPRCTIPEQLYVMHLSADGSRLVTIPWNLHGAPLKVWDTQCGKMLHEFFGGEKEAWIDISPDGATISLGLNNGALWLVDWRSGQSWQVQDVDLGLLPPSTCSPNFGFSSKGRWLFFDPRNGKPAHFVDVASKKVIWRATAEVLQFDSNERRVFARNQESIDVWDLEARKCVATLPARADGMVLSPDGQTLLTHRVLPPPDPTKIYRPVCGVELWDLATLKLRFQREQSPAGNLQTAFSPDGKTLALWLGQDPTETDLAVVDFATGRLRWRYPLKNASAHAHAGQFSADGSLLMVQHDIETKTWTGTLTVFDVASGRVLWEKFGRSLIGRKGILHQEQDGVALFDLATGQRRGTKLLDLTWINDVAQQESISWTRLKDSSEGAYFTFCGGQRQRDRKLSLLESWLPEWWSSVFGGDRSATVVMETATGRELFRHATAGNHAFYSKLSDDASTLVTCDWIDEEHHMTRVWDVHATRAWRWAVGMAVVTGFVVLTLHWAWRRRKARKAAAISRQVDHARPDDRIG